MKTRNPNLNQDEWDRQVTLRLYKEYEHITWAHKVRLRPVTLRLSDSRTYWGKWESETRTISISRRLVQEYSWFHVESILRHEMAHQYVSEILGQYSKDPQDPFDRPHGEEFKRSCELLGVPEEFSKASVQLQETDLDWRKEKRSEEAEKLFSKVQKLLALATSSNENEAFLAMSKVRELYAKYNVNEFFSDSESGSSSKTMVHAVICHKKKRIEAHQDKICGILAGHFFVKVIFCTEYDADTGDSYKAMQLIGTRENVLMAEYVYHFLLRETEFLVHELKRKWKEKKRSLTRIQLKSYRLGILQGFQEKLASTDRELMRNLSSVTEESRPLGGQFGERALTSVNQSLILAKSDQKLDQYLSRVFPRLRSVSAAGQLIDRDSYSSGKVAGNGIHLRKAMTSAGGFSGRLLGRD